MGEAEYIEIVLLVDLSAGMRLRRERAAALLSDFLTRWRRAKARVVVTVIFFAGESKIVAGSVPIAGLGPLGAMPRSLKPGAALCDAVGFAITGTALRIKAMPERERPDRVLFALLACGEDRDSRHFTAEEVVYMVEKKHRENDWEFHFLMSGLAELASLAGAASPNDDGYGQWRAAS